MARKYSVNHWDTPELWLFSRLSSRYGHKLQETISEYMNWNPSGFLEEETRQDVVGNVFLFLRHIAHILPRAPCSVRRQHDIFLRTRVRSPTPFICFWFHTHTGIIKSLFVPLFPGDNSKSTPCIYGRLRFDWNLLFEDHPVAKCVFLERVY